MASASVIRSCGRFGPAMDGTTVDRSRLSSSEYRISRVGSCQRPCSLAYATTRASCCPLRPVSLRYAMVSASIGKIAQVEPNSGDMLPIVARSASGRFGRPAP